MTNPKLKKHTLIAYLNFLLKSTNQHGIHSPFVFDLVTKCFYDRKKYPEYQQLKALPNTPLFSNKKKQLLFRLQRYFNFDTVQLISDHTTSILRIILDLTDNNITYRDASASSEKQDPIAFIYLNTLELTAFWNRFDSLLSDCNNDSIFFINTPHQSKRTEKTWKLIKNHPLVTVSIDSFSFGLICIRKEQRKEHFVIRV